jgi:hypothetical protein
LLDGLRPSLTFADMDTTWTGLIPCRSFLNFWASPAGAGWTPDQMQAVIGYQNGQYTCVNWNQLFVDKLIVPSKGCDASIPADQVYNAQSNPHGARCDWADANKNIYGIDPKTGFGRSILDNVGVQYGLLPLNSGAISVKQFLDINQAEGGFDIEGNPMSRRNVGDVDAIKIDYQTNHVNCGCLGIGDVPIIDYRWNPDPAGVHSPINSPILQARLIRGYGNTNNYVNWTYSDAAWTTEPQTSSLALMSQWVTNVAGNTTSASQHVKVATGKPAAAFTKCVPAQGQATTDPATCGTLLPPGSSPRLQAGGPITDDILKCQLKPVNFTDNKVSFTDAEKARMLQVFSVAGQGSDGVCDYSQPGVGQVTPTATWLSFANGPGGVPSVAPKSIAGFSPASSLPNTAAAGGAEALGGIGILFAVFALVGRLGTSWLRQLGLRRLAPRRKGR